MIKKILSIIVITIALWISAAASPAAAPKRIQLGYFEGGPNPVHKLLRDEYIIQLEKMVPDSIEVVFTPYGFYSAEWNREKAKAMAYEINQNNDIDILIAIGPWVIEELIKVGYKKPIIGMYQFDPKLMNLLDSKNRPKIDNLTLMWNPNKIRQDLTLLSRITDHKKLGWLYFPSDTESVAVFNYVKIIAEELGFKLFTSEEFDNNNTFAYFKAFNNLSKKINMVYLAPLWGLDGKKVSAFFENLNRERKPGFTYDGSLILEKGALATSNYYQVISSARFYVHHSLKIIEGATPADLPIIFSGGTILAINEKIARLCGIEFPDRLAHNYFSIEAPFTEGTDHYTLNDAVHRAITQNPGYLAQTYDIEAADYEIQKIKAARYPHLSARAYYSYLDSNIIHNTYGYLSQDQLAASITLDQKLFSKPLTQALKSSRIGKEISEAETAEFKIQLEKAITQNYLNYLRYKEMKKAYINNRKILDYNIELVTTIDALEGNRRIDLNRLENKRLDLNKSITIIESEIRNQKVQFNALINMPAGTDFLLDSTTFSLESFFKRESNILKVLNLKSSQAKLALKLQNIALSENPSIKKLENRINFKRSLMDQNKADYYPEINLFANLNFHDRLKEDIYFKEKKSSWSIGGGIILPLYLGGERSKEKGRLNALLNKEEYLKDQTALNIMNEVNRNFNNFVAATQNISPAFQSNEFISKIIEDVISDFGKGETTLLDFFDLLNNSLESNLNLIEARYNYYQTMSALYYSTGVNVSDNYSDFLTRFHELAGY